MSENRLGKGLEALIRPEKEKKKKVVKSSTRLMPGVIEILLKEIFPNPNQPRNNGTTPIYVAAQENHIEVVKLLMYSTNNPNEPCNDGTTPIFMAAYENHIEIVKLLMNTTENPNQARNDGATPLSIATQKNHLEIVQLLSQKEWGNTMEM